MCAAITLISRLVAESIKDNVQDLCTELGMTGQCIFSESATQLRADGHTASQSAPQVSLTGTEVDETCTDTSHDLEYDSLPHKLLPDFKQHVQQRSMPPLHSLTLALTDTIAAAEAAAKRADSAFASPIWEQRKTQLKAWGLYAFKAAKAFSKITDGLRLLEELYEATRLVVASRQGGLEIAMLYLEMAGLLGGDKAAEWSSVLRQLPGDWRQAADRLQALQQLWLSSRADMRRASHLKEVRSQHLQQTPHHVCCRLMTVYSRGWQDLLVHIIRDAKQAR